LFVIFVHSAILTSGTGKIQDRLFYTGVMDTTSIETAPGAEQEKDQATPASSLEQLEEIVTKNLPSKAQFIQAGEALKAIRHGKLFRPQFKTWSLYVPARWGFSRQYQTA
jgi:hypothetical protein